MLQTPVQIGLTGNLLDYEIFQLRDELELQEGPDVTFYGKC